MTKQAILEKALLKAHKNGWKPLSTIDWKNVEITQWQGNGMVGIALLYGTKDQSIHWVRELEGIIFNHDFAKALWGEELVDVFDGFYFDLDGSEHNGYTQSAAWKVHLQAMVIADEPIKYLGENI